MKKRFRRMSCSGQGMILVVVVVLKVGQSAWHRDE